MLNWCLHCLKVSSRMKISTCKQFQINSTIDLLRVSRSKVFPVGVQTLFQNSDFEPQYCNIRFPIAKMTIIIATLIKLIIFFIATTSLFSIHEFRLWLNWLYNYYCNSSLFCFVFMLFIFGEQKCFHKTLKVFGNNYNDNFSVQRHKTSKSMEW